MQCTLYTQYSSKTKSTMFIVAWIASYLIHPSEYLCVPINEHELKGLLCVIFYSEYLFHFFSDLVVVLILFCIFVLCISGALFAAEFVDREKSGSPRFCYFSWVDYVYRIENMFFSKSDIGKKYESTKYELLFRF